MAGRHHRVRGGEIFQYRTGEPDVGTHRAGRRGRRSAAPEPEPPASDPDGDRGQPGDGTEWRPDPSGPPEPAATAPATSEANTVRLAIEASPAIPPQRAIEAPPTAPPARPAPTAAPTEPAPPTQQAAHWARNTPPPVQAPARQIAPWAQHTPNGGWPAQNAPTPVPPPLLQHSGGWPAQQAPESGPARGAAARQSGQSPARPPTKPGELPAAGSAARGGVRPRSNADLDAAIARLDATPDSRERRDRPVPEGPRRPARTRPNPAWDRRRPRRLRIGLAVVLVVALAAAGAAAVYKYTISGHTAAGGTPAGARSCIANGPAESGSSFVLDNGAYTMIQSPDAAGGTVAMGISANGQIAGGYRGRDGRTHGFLLNNDAYTTVDAPGARATTLIRVSDKGQRLGVYDDARGACHSFLLNDGTFTAVQVPGAPTEALDFNDSGKVVGDYLGDGGKLHGFLLENGKVTTIDVSGAVATGATTINNDNLIAGYYVDARGKVHGYVRDHDGLITKVDAPGADRVTLPFGIAARSQMVGYFVDAQLAWHGFLTDTDQYTKVDPPGIGTVNQLFDRNDAGKIVGFSGRLADPATGSPGCQPAGGSVPLSCLLVATLLRVWV